MAVGFQERLLQFYSILDWTAMQIIQKEGISIQNILNSISYLCHSRQPLFLYIEIYIKKNDKSRVADMSQSRHTGHDQDMNAPK